MTPNNDLATALDWPLDRLKDAYKDADRRLRPAGLRLVREHGEVIVRPVADHTRAQSALAQVLAHSRGLGYAHYRAAYQVLTGQKVMDGYKEDRKRFVLGRLVNIGALDVSDVEPRLTEGALYAHP